MSALTADEREMVALVARFVDERVAPRVREFEAVDEYPEAFIEEMKQLGFFGLLVPAEHGGSAVSAACFARVTEELAREGLARDIVRAVQDARRGAGLSVGDRISLSLVGDDEVWQAAVTHQALIMTETLAVQFGAGGEGHQLEGVTTALGDGRKVTIAISKVGS